MLMVTAKGGFELGAALRGELEGEVGVEEVHATIVRS
jgi:hypothetical protein